MTGSWEIIIIAAIILVLFGSTKLPSLARSMGRSLRIFKSEINELKAEDEARQKQKIQPESSMTVNPTEVQSPTAVTETENK